VLVFWTPNISSEFSTPVVNRSEKLPIFSLSQDQRLAPEKASREYGGRPYLKVHLAQRMTQIELPLCEHFVSCGGTSRKEYYGNQY
jgi:hypothetical protein